MMPEVTKGGRGMNIQLSDHFTYGKLLRFTLPSVVMMIFTSIYSVVDGFFISNFVGVTPFAAVNLIWPAAMLLSAMGFMFGAGGTALVSLKLGEGKPEEANRIFSLLTYVNFAVGVVLMLLGLLFIRPISVLLGADAGMLPYCVTYGRILLLALPVFMLQNMFQNFLVAAEKPGMGLAVTVAAGVTNMVLDALFIVVFRWGVAGAAAATAISQCVGGVVPLVYFCRGKDSPLRLGKTRFDGQALLRTCTNGMSELVSNISMSLVSMLYNFQLMRLAGENGVAAYGAVMYVSFIFAAVFLGYAIGMAPVVSYHYGAEDREEVRSLFRKSNVLVTAGSIVLAALALVLAAPLAAMFVGRTGELFEMTLAAFRFYAAAVLFGGVGIFGSAFFTALNDGPVSAAISFLRTIVFQTASVLVLPILFGLDGVWYSLAAAEILAALVTWLFFALKRKKYQY